MLILRDMTLDDIAKVMRIEHDIYPYPWSEGNFVDSVESGYLCKIAEQMGEMVGYGVMMPAPGEVHLLTIGIAAPHQRKGRGALLLHQLLELARAHEAERVLLEVRPSNIAAQALYRKCGFIRIGLRRGYYPADNNSREDAIVMACPL